MDVSGTAMGVSATRVLLVRHVHTEMAGRFCGQIDPPISAEGRNQLTDLERRLLPYQLTQVFSSDLLRARQTAEAISAWTGVSVQTVPELREISFGRWEGLSWPEIEARDPEYAERWAREYPRLAAPEGEDFAAFSARVQGALRRVADKSLGGCAAVVTHGGVIRTLLLELLRLPAESLGAIECNYGSCREVLYSEGRWTLPTHRAK
jgi:broad specificity phosphatase PhoE